MKLLTPEKANSLVKEYQTSGDPKALRELIEAFDGYLHKYLCLIRDGTVNLRDKDTRQFLYLFKGKSPTSHDAYRILYVLHNICSHLSREDIYGELVVLFITAVKKYEKRPTGPNFSGFLCNYFRYLVKHWLGRMSKDALSRSDLFPFLPDKRIDRGTEQARTLRLTSAGDVEIVDVRHPILKHLTEEERKILSLYYQEGYSDQDITSLLGKDKVRKVTLARRRAVKICAKLMHRFGQGK